MRELAAGNFEVVLPGLGRRDELGDMAGAVEEFKVQAVARGERDAATPEAQSKAAGAARRAELIRFADDFETAVGAIVADVSSSAVQLEAAAGSLTRTAETTQSLSNQVAGARRKPPPTCSRWRRPPRNCRRPSTRSAAASREAARSRKPPFIQAEQTDGRTEIVARRTGDWRRRQADHGDRRADDLLALNAASSGARRRCRPRLCRGGVGSEVAGQPTARATDEISGSHLGHAGRDAGIGRRDQGDRRHHRKNPGIASTIASAVEQQSSATQEIARSVQNVAQGTQEAASNVMHVNRGATETGTASEEVLNSARTLSSESTRLREELDRFMANIRAA